MSISTANSKLSIYRNFGKRALDIAGACSALALASPLFGAVSAAVWLEDRGPILFRQERVGRHAKGFVIYKFRSMPTHAEERPSAEGAGLPITRVGRMIRRTNIDELPQLVNVIRGDMSLVGPRPALPTQWELRQLRAAGGADVLRPGLTGLAQVMSYDWMPVQEKAAYDNQYSEAISLWRDLKVVLKTFSYLRKPPPAY